MDIFTMIMIGLIAILTSLMLWVAWGVYVLSNEWEKAFGKKRPETIAEVMKDYEDNGESDKR